MVFWITAAAIAIVIAATMIVALMRAKPEEEHPAAYDLRVYRDQLREVDRDLARGVIGAGDAERIRAEVGRRVLAADAQLQEATGGSTQPRGATMALAAITGVALVGGTLALYPVLGQPGARDLPLKERIAASDDMRKSRPGQAEAEAGLPPSPPNKASDPRFEELMEKLRSTVAERPDDLQGLQLLARNEAALGNYRQAYEAQLSVIRIKGGQATAQDHASAAELMIFAAQGYVSPEAETQLRATLEKDPSNQPARYFTGLMMIQNDRADIAFRLWKPLLEESAPDAPWLPAIRNQIGDLALLAGERYTPPEAASAPVMPGPSAGDVANASEMTAEERQQMLQGMVGQLAERLESEGGSPQEWARLVTSQATLGDRDAARAALEQARAAFPGDAAAQATLDQAAEAAGLTE